MTLLRARASRLARWLAALVVAVTVLGPFVDSIACAGEAATAEAPMAATIVDIDQHADAKAGHEPGVCAHGHCHHAHVAIAVLGPAPAGRDLAGTSPAWAVDAPFFSAELTLAKPPPRA